MLVPVSVDYFFQEGSKYEAPQGNVWLFMIIFLSCYLEAFFVRLVEPHEEMVD